MRKYGVFFTVIILLFFLSTKLSWGEAPHSGFSIANPTFSLLYLNERADHSPILLYNNDGIDFTEGVNTRMSTTLFGKYRWFEVMLKPQFLVTKEKTEETIQEGFLRLTLTGLNIDLGKESLWWGPGHHGGLFLTNNAKPFPMIRVFNPNPILLPSVFRYLGPFQFDIFLSRLESNRAIPKPYFQGTRFSFKPFSILDIGLTRTIMMGGEGRPGLSPSRFFDIWFGENKETHADELSNSLAGVDFRLTLPEMQFYGEGGGEDEAGGYPSKWAFLVGAYFPKGKNPLSDMRIEYADISDPSWYVHGLYQSGYTYKGNVLGHHVGGAGKDFYLEKGLVRSNHINAHIHLHYEERGISIKPIAERHYQIGTDWTFSSILVMIPWQMKFDFAIDWVRNAGHNPHAHQENSITRLTIVGQI
ncbi:MAG: capsule assembly Wzi family protein [Nitrospirota bacterium]